MHGTLERRRAVSGRGAPESAARSTATRIEEVSEKPRTMMPWNMAGALVDKSKN